MSATGYRLLAINVICYSNILSECSKITFYIPKIKILSEQFLNSTLAIQSEKITTVLYSLKCWVNAFLTISNYKTKSLA